MLLVYIVAKIRSCEKILILQKTITRSVRIADPLCTAAGSESTEHAANLQPDANSRQGAQEFPRTVVYCSPTGCGTAEARAGFTFL